MKKSWPIFLISIMFFAVFLVGYAWSDFNRATIIVTPRIDVVVQSTSVNDVIKAYIVNLTPPPSPTSTPMPTPTITPTIDVYKDLLPCYATEVAVGDICAPIGPSPTPTLVGPTSTPWVPSCSLNVVPSDSMAEKQKPRPCRKVAFATPTENWVP